MRTQLLIFTCLTFLVVLIHVIFLSDYLNFGMHSDDWICLVRFNFIKENFFSKALTLLKLPQVGLHAVSQVLYIGILESLFGLNNKLFVIINITFKILSALSFYPLICLIFRRKLLAFLTALLYSMSYASAGSFRDITKGTEYLAILFMNIFLIIYVWVTVKKIFNLKWMIGMVLFFALSIFAATPRLFPLIPVPLFIELFLWIFYRNNSFLIKKFLLLYGPILLAVFYHPALLIGALILPLNHLQKIIEGYWFILLNPLSGLGYLMVWNKYLGLMIGNINLENFTSYLIFILSYLLIFFGPVTLIVGLIVSQKKRSFIMFTLAISFILEILAFFLATNHLKMPLEKRVSYDFAIFHSVLVGIWVLSISSSSFREWIEEKKKTDLLLAIWIGFAFSFYFIFLNWLFASTFLTFNPTQEYLTLPVAGISLMIAAILTSLYDKLGKTIAIILILLILIPIYSVNKTRMTNSLVGIIHQNNARMQDDIQRKIRNQVKDLNKGGNILLLFDWTDDAANREFYSEHLHSTFTFWTHFYNKNIIEGCINEIENIEELKSAVSRKEGMIGFVLPGNCLYSSRKDFYIDREVFYHLDNFYAFKVKNNNLTDIRQQTLEKIGLESIEKISRSEDSLSL